MRRRKEKRFWNEAVSDALDHTEAHPLLEKSAGLATPLDSGSGAQWGEMWEGDANALDPQLLETVLDGPQRRRRRLLRRRDPFQA